MPLELEHQPDPLPLDHRSDGPKRCALIHRSRRACTLAHRLVVAPGPLRRVGVRRCGQHDGAPSVRSLLRDPDAADPCSDVRLLGLTSLSSLLNRPARAQGHGGPCTATHTGLVAPTHHRVMLRWSPRSHRYIQWPTSACHLPSTGQKLVRVESETEPD